MHVPLLPGQINNLIRTIIPVKQKHSFFNPPIKKKKVQDQFVLGHNSTRCSKKSKPNTPLIIPQNKHRRGIAHFVLQGYCYPDIQPQKDPTKKENDRQISLMNLDTQIINKIHTNKSKNTSKRSFTMIKKASFQTCRDGSI